MPNDKKDLKPEETPATQPPIATNENLPSNDATESLGEEGTDWVRLESGLGIDE